MAQLHFYVPEETAELLRKRAEQQNLSLSKYLAKIIQREVSGGWPAGYFETVFGSLAEDFSRGEQPALEERLPLEPGGRN